MTTYTPIRPLEKDLLSNATKRLNLWVKDTLMRCDAVDLPGDATVSILLTCLTEVTHTLIRGMEMSPADYCTMLHHALTEVEKRRREAEKHP